MINFFKKSKEKNDLDHLLAGFQKGDRQRTAFYEVLVQSEVFVLVPGDNVPAKENSTILEAGDVLPIATLTSEDGIPFVPVFTSLVELRRSIDEKEGYMAFNFVDLIDTIGDVDIVINPESQHGIYLTSEEIQNVLEYFMPDPTAHEQMVIKERTEILMGLPEEDPVQLKQVLAKIFGKTEKVQSAYLAMVVYTESSDHSFTVGVVFKPGQEDREVFKIAGPEASKHLPEGYFLDFMVINDNDDRFQEIGMLFYRSA